MGREGAVDVGVMIRFQVVKLRTTRLAGDRRRPACEGTTDCCRQPGLLQGSQVNGLWIIEWNTRNSLEDKGCEAGRILLEKAYLTEARP